jgi:DNA-binding transcriptional MerR regulator
MSIGELATRVDATPAALRYWERAGLLDGVERVGGRRRYPARAVARVGLIRLCQDAGFGIGEIRTLLEADPRGGSGWRTSVEAKLDAVGQQIRHLQTAASMLEHILACPHPVLTECPSFTAFVHWRAEGGDPPEQRPDAEDAQVEVRRSGLRGGGGG